MLAATFMNPGLHLSLELGVDSASSVFTLSCLSKIHITHTKVGLFSLASKHKPKMCEEI